MSTLIGGGIPVTVTMPTSINANITNASVPVTVSNTVTVEQVLYNQLLEKEYVLTGASQQIPTIDIPSNCKSFTYQFIDGTTVLTQNDVLFVRYDGIAVTGANGGRVRPEIGIEVETRAAALGFRFLGIAGAKLKVFFYG